LYVLGDGIVSSNCRCKQVLVKPGELAEPFVDFREEVRKLDDKERTRVVGKASLRLIESGVVGWDDVVTPTRIRTFQDVVYLNRLTAKNLKRAGISPGVAVNALIHAAEARGQVAAVAGRPIAALKGQGLAPSEIRAKVAAGIADRIGVRPLPRRPPAAPPPAPKAAPPAPKPPGGLPDLSRPADVLGWLRRAEADADASGVPAWRADGVLGRIREARGFNGLPEIGDVDAAIRSGGTEAYRGVTAPGFAEAFRSGPHFPGLGFFGNGTYAAYPSPALIREEGGLAGAVARSRRTAGEYAGPGGELMRMALKPGAVTAAYEDVAAEVRAYLDAIAASAALSAADLDDLENLISDPGRYAAWKGLQAILVDRSGFLVLLDRRAVVVGGKPR
jgi:hypothetical protein